MHILSFLLLSQNPSESRHHGNHLHQPRHYHLNSYYYHLNSRRHYHLNPHHYHLNSHHYHLNTDSRQITCSSCPHTRDLFYGLGLFSALKGGSYNFWDLLFGWHHTSSQMRRSVSLLERSLISVVIIYLTTSGNGHRGPTYKIKTAHPTQASFSVVLAHKYRLKNKNSLIILE